MSTGGAGCDRNSVVEGSILGGGEIYFWEDIVRNDGGLTGEGLWVMRFVGIVDNADGWADNRGGRSWSGR